MGLSLNPLSWTPSNLAEEAVEFITGSEGAGDVAGLWMAGATGDIKGMAEQGMDLGENIVAGGKAFVDGFGKALKDGAKEFSNPGCVKSPSQDGTKGAGYAEGTAASQSDTGVVGKGDNGVEEAKGGKARPDSADEAQSRSEMNSILNDPSASLEDKIFALLMFLNKKKEGDVEKTVKKLADKEGKGEKLTSSETNELQKVQGDLSQLNNLTTSMMQSFKQMKDAVIQNIGR